MAPSELRRRLHAADPDLNIVPGGRRHGSRKGNWEAAAGAVCRECGEEYQRGRDGLCYRCWEKMEEDKVVVIDQTGITNFLPMSIIEQITHQSRKKE